MKLNKNTLREIIREELDKSLVNQQVNISGEFADADHPFVWYYPQLNWEEDARKILQYLHTLVTGYYNVSHGAVPTKNLRLNYTWKDGGITFIAKERSADTWKGESLGGQSYHIINEDGILVDKSPVVGSVSWLNIMMDKAGAPVKVENI